MHGLDVIIIRNAAAAGREAAEHDKAGRQPVSGAIHEAEVEERQSRERVGFPIMLKVEASLAFTDAYSKESGL